MGKTRLARLVWIISALVALIAIILILFLSKSSEFYIGKSKLEKLPENQAILVNTSAEPFGVQKGDVFLYVIEVLYDPNQISEIDKVNLDDAVNLEPFEIRDIREIEYEAGARTHIYQRQYEIQLITGEVEHLYEFPSIVVRYKPIDAAGLFEITVVPEAVYVAPRLPDDIIDLTDHICNQGDMYCRMDIGFGPLKPLTGEIEGTSSQNKLPWILLIFGSLVAIVVVSDLMLRVIPQSKENAKQSKITDSQDILYQSYLSLNENYKQGISPKKLLLQIENILRVIISEKEKISSLESLNLNSISSKIKPAILSLFEKSQKAYRTEFITNGEVEEAFSQLESVLKFYYGDEVETWKN